MMTKKKRQIIIIISILTILAIVSITLIILYLKTDIFKSKKTLFIKYLESSIDNASTVLKDIKKDEYEAIKSNNMYTSNKDINIKYVEELGTTSENTNNEINNVSVNIKGQSDKNSNYKYDKISIKQEENNIFGLEYIKSDNNYGIRFSDLFKQFIISNDGSLSKIFKTMGYQEEQLSNIPENLDIENELNSIFNITKEEETIIKNKYIDLINENISDNDITKKSNQIVQINNRNISTNAYIITLTKEQFNNLSSKVLETLKEDEIILGKLDRIDKLIQQWSFIMKLEKQIDIKDDYISKINERIESINRTNIGNEETQIIIYENEGNAVRFSIQYVDYKIDIDFVLLGEEKYLQVKADISGNNAKLQNIILSSKINGINFSILNQTGSEKEEISYVQDLQINETDINDNINVIYESNEQRLTVDILNKINIVDNLRERIDLNNDNSIILNNIDDNSSLITLIKKIDEAVKQEVNNNFNEKTKQDIKKVLQRIGVLEEKYEIEVTEGTTEAERNRFNSKFEILQGKDITGNSITKIVDIISKNVSNLEVSSDTKLKIKIDVNNVNEQLANKLSDFMNENKDKKYDVSVEYDETTGYVNYVNIDVVEDD